MMRPWLAQLLCRTRGAHLAVLVLLASLLTPTGARGFEPQAPELDRWLAAIESDRPPIGNRAALGLLERLERRDGQKRAEFDAAARRELPAKAAGRLAQARAAYEAGQGRLLGLLREISGSTAGVERAAAAREARAILTRLSDASRREPLSAELKVHAPALTSGPPPARSGAAPGPEAAIGPVPPALQALADSLSGPIEAYAWVRNNLRSEFYYGSLKGPLQAFLDKSGNDADSAAVLIALLRARGIPARFVQGTAQVEIARLMAVTGTATPEQAVRVLERAGIPHEPIVGTAGVTAVKMARVWAEAYLPYANYRGLPVDAQGKLWLPLDPGFKDLHAPTGHDVVTELGLDPRALVDEYLAAPRGLTPRGFLRQRVGELLAPLGLTYEQALNDRSLLPEELGILPNALPYKPVGPTDASYDAPLPHAIRVVGEWNGTTLIDATLPLPTVLGQRLTLSYVPFDQDDAQTVARYGSLHLTPPYLIDVKPVLKLGGVPIAAGEAAVGMAVKYDLRVELSFPGGREDVHNQVLAGNLMAIGLAGGEAAGQEQQNDQAAGLLARAASEYLRGWNQSDAELADLFRVAPVRPTASACFVMSDIEVEYAGGDPLYPISFDWKGVAVDADLRASAPAGVEGRAAEPRFALMSGLEGSILENRLFEDLWNVPSVSTAKALQLAAQQGASAVTITSGNVDAVLPGLPFDAAVKAEIRDAALRGFTVRVPEAPVSFLAWTGVGYWILDEETGESAWQLQGGHSGGVTAPANPDWPAGPLAETLIDQGEAAAQSANEVKRILKFVSTDYQDGIVDKPLGRPFRVLVVDAEGHRIPLAPVTFQVIGGGGGFPDPTTGRESSTITVLSNARGEAEVTLKLGRRTDEIPRYTCPAPDPAACSVENDFYATQVGLNVVTAFAGQAALNAPFMAYGNPDNQWDGTHQYGYISFRTWPAPGDIKNLRVAGPLAMNVRDQHGNPLSNIELAFDYRPLPILGTPPAGWEVVRGATTTPGKLLSLRDYLRCIEETPTPRYGECRGEDERLRARSSRLGVEVYPVIGDSPYSGYYFDIGTNAAPALTELRLGTWGRLCESTGWQFPPCSYSVRERWPITWVEINQRPRYVNATGKVIEAYAPGASAPLLYSAHVIYEGYIVEPFVDHEGNTRYNVSGTNQWTREPLDDNRIVLTPATSGTTVSPSVAAHSGNGVYKAQMTMASTPQLNTVKCEASSTPWLIPPYMPLHPIEVDPSAVDPVTLQITKRKFPDEPWQTTGSFSLWGVRADIQAVQPTPIRVDEGRVVESAAVVHGVEPAAYLARLAPTDLRFILNRDGQPVLAASGTDGSPFQIPAGLAFPAGDYTAQLRIPGVSWGGGGIESAPYPVEACELMSLQTRSVILPAHGTQGSGCEIQDKIRFTLCRDSAVTVLLGGQLLIEAPMGPGEHVVQVPRDVALSFHSPVVPFLVRAVEDGSSQPAHEAWGAVTFADDLIKLDTPEVKLRHTLDPVNNQLCPGKGEMRFSLCDAAKVSIAVDDWPLEAKIDGGPKMLLDGIELAAGPHVVQIDPSLLGLDGERKKPFKIDAESLADPSIRDSAEGEIISTLSVHTVLPLGHTFVKGVDLLDGHLAVQEVDFGLPGRHLGLEMSRTYSSSGLGSEGILGAGWNWSYGLSLHESICEETDTTPQTTTVTLTARDGSQAFHDNGDGSYQPQVGYHGRLVKNGDGTFDYFDKANVQHRFASLGLGSHDYRLEYLSEPHGDRLVMTYESLRPTKVTEEQDGQPVRELRLTYAPTGFFGHIARAEVFEVGGTAELVRVDYEYDEDSNNLVKVTRLGRNLLPGLRAADRVHEYNYSVNDWFYRNHLTEIVDPNGNRTRFQYYEQGDVLPGEGGYPGGWFLVGDKLQRVKAVYEYPDRAHVDEAHALVTRFSYDLTAWRDWHYTTTVTDAAERETLYVQLGNGATVEVHEPLGKNMVMTWNSFIMRKETELDAKGRLTRFTWDARGNLASETIETGDPDLGNVATSYVYDQTYNKLLSKTDAENRTSTWALDPHTGDVTEALDAAENRTTYTYGNGLLRSTTDARGHSSGYSDYNGFGQARLVTDPLGNTTHREYDARGRLAVEYDSFGRRTEYQYDGLDRVITLRRLAADGSDGQRTNPDDQVTTKTYYPGGQVASETNANGARTVYTLDGLNRVVATETQVPGQAVRTTTTTTYDSAGNKETETDARGVKRTFIYDDLNRLTQVSIEPRPSSPSGPSAGPIGEVAAYDYDLVGNKLWEKDLAGLQTAYQYDALYRVKTKLLPEPPPPADPLKEEYAYDKVGNRISVKDANGRETRYEYDGLNRVTKTIQDPGGLALTTTVRYCNAPASDPPGGMGINKCEQREMPKGLRTLFDYDDVNRETRREVRLEGADGDSVTDVYVTETAYDDSRHEVSVTDPNTHVTRTKFDGLDREVERVVDSGGLKLTARTYYDGLGDVTRVEDPRGNATRSEFDGLGRLMRRTDAKNASSTYEYDAGGLRTLEVDRRGVRKRFEYDNLGRQVRAFLENAAISGQGWSHDTEYRDRQRLRIETDARGRTTTFKLDGLNRVIEETDANNQTAFTTWDGVNKVAQTDRRHHETRFKYDAVNRLTLTTDPAPFASQTLAVAYDDAANLVTEIDRRGTQKVTQRDALGRVRSVTGALGKPEEAVLERNTYDGNGNKIVALDGESKRTEFAFDGANRLKERTDGAGSLDEATTSYEYDESGNQTIEQDQRARDLSQPYSVKREYDKLNRLTDLWDGLGNHTVYGYDPEGNRTLVREPKGQETTFTYDELGKLRTVIQPGNAVTRYVYDPNRNKVEQEDANRHLVSFEYDNLNRLTRQIQPGGVRTDHQYDENGNETLLTDPNRQTVTSAYDELNRLKTKTYAFADSYRPWRYTTGVAYSYDPNGNLTGTDESVVRTTPSPVTTTLTTTRIYDRLNRLTSETTDLPDVTTLPSRTVSFGYYGNGTRRTVTDSALQVTFYSYDGQNRLQGLTTAYGTPQAATTTYSYWPDNLLKEVTLPSGVKTTHSYDQADRLTMLLNAKGASVLSSYAYGYDHNGNRTSQVELNGGTTETTAYTYDDLNRMATVTYPVDATYANGRVVTYGYDPVGNRTQETERDNSNVLLSDKAGVFDDLNRLTALNDLVNPANSTTFAWDNNGNQITKTKAGVTTSYHYDVRDKLVEVGQGASILGRFQYDFEGRRNVKIGEFGTEQYVYDGTSTFLEYDQDGTLKAKYDYGSDRLIGVSRLAGSLFERRYYSFDALRSVTNLSDTLGTVKASYHLDAWGNFRFPSELNADGDTVAAKNRFAFTGYLWDRETNLFFAKARFYDPEVGRFISQDSYLGQVDDPPSLHRYFYANDNPTRYVDPTGHDPVEPDERVPHPEPGPPPTPPEGEPSHTPVSAETLRKWEEYAKDQAKKHPTPDAAPVQGVVSEDVGIKGSGDPAIDAEMKRRADTMATIHGVGEGGANALRTVWNLIPGTGVVEAAAGESISGKKVDRATVVVEIALVYVGTKLAFKVGGKILHTIQDARAEARAVAEARALGGEARALEKEALAAEKELGAVAPKSGAPSRPAWQTSEADATAELGDFGFGKQPSYAQGKGVPYGTPGSVRPDLSSESLKLSVDVKNYKVTTPQGRYRLVQDVVGQTGDRAANLPQGMRQGVIIDMRGQTLNQNLLDRMIDRIVKQSNGLIQRENIHVQR